MVSRIHEKLGTAGFVIAIVALIAALGGTALAAVGLNGKQKKEVTKIAKKYAGEDGKPGASGAAGPQGAKGDPGEKGATGSQGAPGAPGKNGVDGEDGACSVSEPECVLPPGATLTGVYVFNQEGAGGEIPIEISFPLPVKPDLFASAEEIVEYISPEDSPTTDCPGSVQLPDAAPGHICIYGEAQLNAFDAEVNFSYGTTGLVRKFESENEAERSLGRGTWAVTAKCPGGAESC